MDRGQETTEVKDSNSNKVAASSSIVQTAQQGASVSTSQRLLLARERNDRNRDHLSTAFRVYKQLYGEEAAKEAFIEIAANIAKDEEDDSHLDLALSEDAGASNTLAGLEGGAPRYLSYRQSLSLQKDRTFLDLSSHSNSAQNPHPTASKTPSTEIAGSTLPDKVYYQKLDNNNSALRNEVQESSTRQILESNISVAQNSEDDNSLPVVSAVHAPDLTTSAISDTGHSTEPPRYIKYRASLSTKSASSSYHGDVVNISRMSSDDDTNSNNLSLAASVGTSEAILMSNVNTGKRDFASSTREEEEEERKMPRYVKYRASLSKAAHGSHASMTPMQEEVLPNISSISEDDPERVSRTHDGEEYENNNAQLALRIGALAAIAGLDGTEQENPPSRQIDENASSIPNVSHQRYMAYRSSLKDKPWTTPNTGSSLYLASEMGGMAATEPANEQIPQSYGHDTDSGQIDTSGQSSGADSTEGASTRQRRNIIPESSPERLGTETSFDVSEGASAESILSDLQTVEKVGSPNDDRTLISASTEASASNVPSVAEQLLISSSGSDDGMGLSLTDQSTTTSFADHSAATPIISNSAHKKSARGLKTPSGANFLSYETASSFDSDSHGEDDLVYLASVPSSPGLVEGNRSGVESIAVSPTSTDDPVANASTAAETNRNVLELEPKPLNSDYRDSFDDEDSNDGVTGRLALSNVQSSAPSPVPQVTDATDSSDSDSSSSETSSSSGSSTSSSDRSEAMAFASKLDTSIGSELAVQTAAVDVSTQESTENKKLETNTMDLDPKSNTKSTVESSQPNESPDEDIEAGNISCLGKMQSNGSIFSKDQDRRKKLIYALLLFLFLILIIGLGVGIPLARKQNHVGTSPTVAPVNKRTSIPTFAPSPSGPVTASPTVPGALFALLSSLSTDNGLAMTKPGTPQYQAFQWLADDPELSGYDDSRRVQRYSLVTFFYSTNGANWTDNTGWATYTDECDWFSRSSRIASCDDIGRFRNLDLGFNEVSGTVPPELGMLTRLSRVIISGGIRKTLTGSLPSELGLLARMETFLIQGNSLYGTIPKQLDQWINIETADFSMNNLSGSIPNDIGSWQSIRFLDFSGNRFDGIIPSSIEQLTNLERLSLGDNGLTGEIPSTVDQLTSLKVLNLEKNQITAIPTQIGNMRNLETLTVYENKLKGQLITEIGSLVALRRLSLNTNSLTGPIPAELGSIASLRYLDLSANKFSGPIPKQIGQLSDILSLQLESNQLSGNVPVEFENLSSASLIRIDSNNITGKVPKPVCDTFTVEFPTFYADCAGENPQVECPESCCTFCCTDTGVCDCTFKGTPYEFLCR